MGFFFGGGGVLKTLCIFILITYSFCVILRENKSKLIYFGGDGGSVIFFMTLYMLHAVRNKYRYMFLAKPTKNQLTF